MYINSQVKLHPKINTICHSDNEECKELNNYFSSIYFTTEDSSHVSSFNSDIDIDHFMDVEFTPVNDMVSQVNSS